MGSATLNVVSVRVDSLRITDLADGTVVTNPSSTRMFVADVDGQARISLDAIGVPMTSDAGAHVLWDVLGGAHTGPTPKNFGGADPTITLTPGSGSRVYDVKIGFDNNGNGSLQVSEIDRMITVYVVKLTLAPPRFQDGTWADESMENATLSYGFTALGLPTDTYNYTEHWTNGAGAWQSGTFVDDDEWIRLGTSPTVADGDADHRYTHQKYISMNLDGRTFTSNTVELEVYELWIEYFRDDATDKPWQVCVGDAIEYSAIASNDITEWIWDMEDGVEDAWNPTGGNAKSGNGMVIPFSDLSDAENDWFGATYGTVTVYAKDHDGVWHTFHSTDMTTPQKANVFFDPNKALDGNAPAVSKPPAWFVYWQQAGAGDENVAYDHTLTDYGVTERTQDASGVITSVSYPKIGLIANGSATLGYTGTTITGIDTFHITVRHEMLHYQDRTASIGAPNPDGDGLATSIEGDQNGDGIISGGETDPTVAQTYPADTDPEYRAYWSEGNVWNVEIGDYDSVDWSKGGKQW